MAPGLCAGAPAAAPAQSARAAPGAGQRRGLPRAAAVAEAGQTGSKEATAGAAASRPAGCCCRRNRCGTACAPARAPRARRSGGRAPQSAQGAQRRHRCGRAPCGPAAPSPPPPQRAALNPAPAPSRRHLAHKGGGIGRRAAGAGDLELHPRKGRARGPPRHHIPVTAPQPCHPAAQIHPSPTRGAHSPHPLPHPPHTPPWRCCRSRACPRAPPWARAPAGAAPWWSAPSASSGRPGSWPPRTWMAPCPATTVRRDAIGRGAGAMGGPRAPRGGPGSQPRRIQSRSRAGPGRPRAPRSAR
jgi:hypothetical protein